jgi:hypothetical protein
MLSSIQAAASRSRTSLAGAAASDRGRGPLDAGAFRQRLMDIFLVIVGAAAAMAPTESASTPPDPVVARRSTAGGWARPSGMTKKRRRARTGMPDALAVTVPPNDLEGTPPTLLRRRMVANHGDRAAVRSRPGARHALPIPGHSHSHAMDHRRMRTSPQPEGICGEPGAR